MFNHDHDHHSGNHYATGVDMFSNQAFPSPCDVLDSCSSPFSNTKYLSDQPVSWWCSAELAHPGCPILIYGQPTVVVLHWAHTVAKRTISLIPAPWVGLIWAEHRFEIPRNFYPSLFIWEWGGQAFRPSQWEYLDCFGKHCTTTLIDSTSGLDNPGLLVLLIIAVFGRNTSLYCTGTSVLNIIHYINIFFYGNLRCCYMIL